MINKTTGYNLLIGSLALATLAAPWVIQAAQEAAPRVQEYPVPAGSHPHDVAPHGVASGARYPEAMMHLVNQ